MSYNLSDYCKTWNLHREGSDINVLKAVKDTMFVLPLPMEKTLSDLRDLSVDAMSSLLDPELYIFVD